MSFNIWQKKHKVRNPYKIVLHFSSSNFGSILANSFFGSISNKDDQENSTSGNSTFRIIYKSGNQIAENRANIEYKLVIKESQGVKKPRLTLEKKNKEASKVA